MIIIITVIISAGTGRIKIGIGNLFVFFDNEHVF